MFATIIEKLHFVIMLIFLQNRNIEFKIIFEKKNFWYEIFHVKNSWKRASKIQYFCIWSFQTIFDKKFSFLLTNINLLKYSAEYQLRKFFCFD